MRNLKGYGEDAFEFYKSVVDAKRNTKDNPRYKERLLSYHSILEGQFDLYNRHYNGKSLEQLVALTFSEAERADILALYSYRSKAIQNLKIRLTTTETNRIISTCQNCTIGEVNSMDHIVPKEMFAEFAVNPKNLFPSCTKCNSFKLNSWLDGDRRMFLNLFLDELPAAQYLFVTTTVTKTNIEAKFEVENRFSIEPELFRLIASHYERLYLCKRFTENSSEVITALINSMTSYSGMLEPDEIVAAVRQKVSKDRDAFGANYWKTILELSLVENSDYIATIFPMDKINQ